MSDQFVSERLGSRNAQSYVRDWNLAMESKIEEFINLSYYCLLNFLTKNGYKK